MIGHVCMYVRVGFWFPHFHLILSHPPSLISALSSAHLNYFVTGVSLLPPHRLISRWWFWWRRNVSFLSSVIAIEYFWGVWAQRLKLSNFSCWHLFISHADALNRQYQIWLIIWPCCWTPNAVGIEAMHLEVIETFVSRWVAATRCLLLQVRSVCSP